MFLQLVLKGFKLKKLVVEPKMAHPVQPNEELIDSPAQPVEKCKEPSLFRTIVQPVKV